MTFYDADRIRRKNEKYEKTKAYEIINKLKSKGMSPSEVASAIDILIKDDNTEFHQSVLERAKSLIAQDQEDRDEAVQDDVNNFAVCPLLMRNRQISVPTPN